MLLLVNYYIVTDIPKGHVAFKFSLSRTMLDSGDKGTMTLRNIGSCLLVERV